MFLWGRAGGAGLVPRSYGSRSLSSSATREVSGTESGEEIHFRGAEFLDHLGRVQVLETGHPNKDRVHRKALPRPARNVL